MYAVSQDMSPPGPAMNPSKDIVTEYSVLAIAWHLRTSGLDASVPYPARRALATRACRSATRVASRKRRRYDSGWPMLTSQETPNWSAHMPNSSPQTCLASGIVTVPPADSLPK